MTIQHGTLKRWNDKKGFGFIQVEETGEDVFLHISAIRNSSRRPVAGDVCFFQLTSDENGRCRAVNVTIQGEKSVFTERPISNSQPINDKAKQTIKLNRSQYKANSRHTGNRLGRNLIYLIVLLFGIFFLQRTDFKSQTVVSSQTEPEVAAQVIPSQFQCAGKTRCTEMVSCEEALFYLRNCPGSVTDGDDDGIPCEDQWCGH